jgi:alpha(1,3/1,4) fucosyltransferase
MIKINFCDFWPDLERDNWFLDFLMKHFNVRLDDNPDYLFFSVYGNNHLNYNDCIKILYTGENIVPDFNLCDYALGTHYLDFGERYLRFPLYIYYQWDFIQYLKKRPDIDNWLKQSNQKLHKREFCNFIYSNNANSDPMRDLFFNELNKYKKVDSGGGHLNNIGKRVEDKLEFIKDYKFTIAFENSSVPGYTTEKLIEPILMKSLPVYYGNPLVERDFNLNSFIWVKDHSDFNRAIEEIIMLDNDDELYIKKLETNKFIENNNILIWEEKLFIFFENIFNQPVNQAFRRPLFGYNKYHLEELRIQAHLFRKRAENNSRKSKIKSLITSTLNLRKK